MKNCFRAPRLFLSRGGFEKWAAPAADSHPEGGEFWERVAMKVGNAPSSLYCILPDYRTEDAEVYADAAAAATIAALSEETVERIGRGFILTERKLKNGAVRTGIVAALDLEQYSYARGEITPARATEGPSSRTDLLLRMRKRALLEFPHTLLFYRDKKNKVSQITEEMELEILYDFDLMADGGHIRGSYIPREVAGEVAAAMVSRGEPCFAVADGHDELVAAKRYWEGIKPTLRPSECKNHPARFALVECINLYDPAVELFPVHRLITDTDEEAFADYFSRNVRCKRQGNVITCTFPAGPASIAKADAVIDGCLRVNGGNVSYSEDAENLLKKGEGVLVLYPPMKKDDLFYALKGGELMPRHSFTIGEDNKRFCFEGREITYD